MGVRQGFAVAIHAAATNVFKTMGKFDDTEKTLLIVDDDPVFTRSLMRAMERRRYVVTAVHSIAEALDALAEKSFAYATIDLRIADENGLDLIEIMARQYPQVRAVVLTAYGNVPTAVSATKLGAYDYLAKPADADAIEQALHGTTRHLPEGQTFPRAEVQEFRYLLAMYEQHGRNMSETARAVGMHRRTLQRILRRHGVGPSEQIPAEARSERPHLRRMYRLWSALLAGDAADRPRDGS